MSAPVTSSIARELAAILGEAHVAQPNSGLAGADAERYATTDGIATAVRVSPATAQEVASVLRFASSQKLAVVPAGGCTKQGIGGLPGRVDVLIDLTRLRAIEHYDPGDLTIGVQAGATLAQVQAVVGAHRQVLPLDAACADRATIGGVLATAAHGPMKFNFGGAREFCVGIEFATAAGNVVKGGGRVVKNVAGYDLMKLMIGSYGTLGVITSANFRLFPAPPQYRTFLMQFATPEELLAARDRIVRSPLAPLALELVSPQAANYLGGALSSDCWRLLLRAGGSDAVLNRYRQELGTLVSESMGGDYEAEFWRTVSDFAATVVAWRAGTMTVDVHVPMTAIAAVLQAAGAAAAQRRLSFAAVGRASGSLVLSFVPMSALGAARAEYADTVAEVREALPPDGSAVVTYCPPQVRRELNLWGPAPSDVATMRLLKHALDPDDIINRGRYLV